MTDTSNPIEPDGESLAEDPVLQTGGEKNDDNGVVTNTPNKDNSSSKVNASLTIQKEDQVTRDKSKGPSPISNNSCSIQSHINLNSGPSQSSSPQISTEQQLQKSKRDLESMVLKYAKSEQENIQNQNKVNDLDRKLKRAIKDNDQLANRIKLLSNDKSHLTDTLNAKVAQLTVLEQKNSFLNNVQGVKLKEYEEKIEKLEGINEDLLKQIESYKSKEGELLDFSERLSMKHMMLQSELDEALKKVPNYKEHYELALKERDNLLEQVDELNKQIELLTESLKREKLYCNSLRNDKEESELKYRSKVDELENEIKVTRRKNQMATKELIKEIKLLQTQLEKAKTKPLSAQAVLKT